jgi:hypothetical protein
MTLATQLQRSIVILGGGIVEGCIRRRRPPDVRIRHEQVYFSNFTSGPF